VTVHFPRYCDFLNVNSLDAGLVGVWELIAIFIEYGGNLARSSKINVAQLRVEPQPQVCIRQNHFTKISDSKLKWEVQQ
jgi:hypothetical protein